MIKLYLTDLNNSQPTTPIEAPALYLYGCTTVTTVVSSLLHWLRCTVTLGCVDSVIQRCGCILSFANADCDDHPAIEWNFNDDFSIRGYLKYTTLSALAIITVTDFLTPVLSVSSEAALKKR